MEKTEKYIISTSTLITSLLCYSYARANQKDAGPYAMVGAFLGTLIGEALAEEFSKQTYKSLSDGNSRNTDI
jgi:hypothetical protein